MGRVDDRPKLSLEGEDRSSQGNSITESQREKRKSEVLIAAQSIENEVQSVKSLKRISIGSIDLLIDPEMEFRVSNPNARRSWSSNSSSSGEEADIRTISSHENELNINSQASGDIRGTDGPETSFDITSADYLQSSDSVPDGSDTLSSSSYSQRTGSPQHSVRRILTGVGSLRRGGVNAAVSEDSSSVPVDDGSSGPGNSILSKQLFWVPANQHPSVKPENYLELVQDTLHSIQLDDKDEMPDSADQNDADLASFERAPIDLARKRDSLVRRPSRLRKSYTEFEDDAESEEDENYQEGYRKAADEAKGPGQSLRGSMRAVSLKDITEELNKISNNAGLTSSDAITLARTLSMAGTYSNADNNSKEGDVTKGGPNTINAYGSTKYEDEGEFASNMLMRYGVVIPARSSLRRSKFNTYRIRSSGSTSSLTSEHSNVENRGVTEIKEQARASHESRKELSVKHQPDRNDLVKAKLPTEKQTESTLSSPSTISDFQDIYDHYRHSSVEWEKELDVGLPRQADSPLANSYVKLREKEIHAVGNSPSIQDTKLLETGSLAENEEDPAAIAAQDSSEKKSSWSWLNGITTRDSIAEKQVKSDSKPLATPDDEAYLSNNLERVRDHSRAHLGKLANQSSNHSKNRHSPIFNASESAKPGRPPAESDGASSNSSNLKRQRFEKKFVNLFKRKAKNKLTGHKISKDSVNGDASGNSSGENLPRSGKLNKNHIKLKSESGAEEHLRNAQSALGHVSSGGPEEHSAKQESDVDELPALQPAVSVTSLKSNHGLTNEPSVVESVRELNGDDSQDVSADQSADSSIDLMQEALVIKEPTNDLQANGKPVPPPSNKHVIPPRKLTFDDVKRPDRPNAAMNFTDSAFGFPLPMLTVSTVIMFDHRLPINVERAIYRLSHLKLSDPKRDLRQQVILSNFMYAYLNLVNHTLYMEQAAQEDELSSNSVVDNPSNTPSSSAAYKIEHNSANGSICIPDI
ncbi:hypothetical protein HG536_0H00670 [Torulaspora globosa]|uniref:Protein Zds1 C-terminal domain-containing protein n=1 Tax=Torulaspora globosa TaxID=48254 RepID=A0A7G3ZMF6_9SACH|nr:uncharacterized protein HG536_0H00670 [Torulaspora globosa]QLL34692.1 hypothetical protein HG536_0H00670 [Torulaspora globosa]